MILEKLILENFLTYEYLEYEFEQRPLLIQGRNLTDEGQKSNGSGKSGIQTGIEFAITASNSRDVRDSELVSYGQKEATVQLIASCNVRKERIYIDWTIKAKGSNKLTLSKQKFNEDWAEVSFSNVNDGKKWIMSWFAISKEDLFNYYIINNTRFKSFFKSSNKEKVELINRFSDASIVDGLENIDTSKVQSEIDVLHRNIDNLNGKIELTEINLLKEKARDFEDELKEEALSIENEVTILYEKVSERESYISSFKDKEKILNSQIEELESNVSVNIQRKNTLQQEVASKTEFLSQLKNSVNEAQVEVEDFVKTDWRKEREAFSKTVSSNKQNLASRRGDKSKIEAQENKILKALNQIDVKLSGSIECPKCTHKFLLDGNIGELERKRIDINALKATVLSNKDTVELSISKIQEVISELEGRVSEVNSKEYKENTIFNKLTETLNGARSNFQKGNDDINKLNASLNQCSVEEGGMRDKISKIRLHISGFKDKKINASQNIRNLIEQVATHRDKIKALQPANNKELINSMEKDLQSFKTLALNASEELLKTKDLLYERNQWISNFKQFKMFLANQSLDAIEFHGNRFLSDMQSDLRIKYEGYKVLANGSFKDEITAKIIRGNERSFGSFSGGEKGRLLFASILANRHMINQTHPYGGFDFLSIDEVFEGVDGVGLKKLISSAKKLNITVMIITHVTDEETTGDILIVEKVNGVSNIVKN